ncbi:di-heme oxidoredictase family protein [Limibacter armeniacum]|uniref:di-heme oxidoreductase family protein n=1 Tax=Limibacter armeniacum TaxID=466084 RepID=UPI002FE5259C
MKKVYLLSILLLGLLACEDKDTTVATSWYEEGEEFPGGATSHYDISVNAFSNPAPNLEGDGDLIFVTGNSFFNRNWVKAPSSTEDLDGLGPFFNSRSCAGCHFKDGRGKAPDQFGDPLSSMLVRLSVPGSGSHGEPVGEPTYGGQLANNGILEVGESGEGELLIAYEEITGEYADGEKYTIRKPTYTFNLNLGEFESGVMYSPRVANQMIGLGLLEAVETNTILSFADEFDTNKDGISGRPNMVWDMIAQKEVIGRFGWKANMPNLKQQVAGAFLGDIGITSSLFPDESCTDLEQACNETISGGKPELKESILDKVTFYSSTLAVPVRSQAKDEEVLKGKALFKQLQCSGCHIPSMTTGAHTISALAYQTIFPYTDLLLHDMGDDLADNRPDFQATGNEWRTPPLWGIGLIETVNGHTQLLHDGRARNVEEAILWHGGEASKSKESFIQLSAEERTALITFVNSL